MVLEPDLTGERLLAELIGLLGNPSAMFAMGQKARALARPGAAAAIAALLKEQQPT